MASHYSILGSLNCNIKSYTLYNQILTLLCIEHEIEFKFKYYLRNRHMILDILYG